MSDLDTVIKFLLGEGELDGLWFGEEFPEHRKRGKWWWRTNLREAWNRRSMTQEERDALEHGAACLVTSGWHKGESSGERAMQNAAILRRLAAVEKG